MDIPYATQQSCPSSIRDRHRLTTADILPRRAYAQCRRQWLPRVRNYLRKRRVRLNANVSLLFENAITVRHQVQEVLYWETSNDKAAHARTREELEAYRLLLPTPSGLTATLLVDGGSRETGLAIGEALASGRSSIGLVIGNVEIPACLADRDPDPAEPVKFLRFDLTQKDRRVVLSGGPASVWILEGEKPVLQNLNMQTVSSLADDIKSEGPQALSNTGTDTERTDGHATTSAESWLPGGTSRPPSLGVTGTGS